jgi:acyl-coenzyme A thioesterase PaaI-like protein
MVTTAANTEITIMATAAVAAPTDAVLRSLCAREHPACFACRPVAQGGLGLEFAAQADGSVSATWTCPPGGESYTGIVHGGLLATALDSAMVHALFARGIVARTGELEVRYRQSAQIGRAMTVRAWLRDHHVPLFRLEAEILQDGVVCAHSLAKFMAAIPVAPP